MATASPAQQSAIVNLYVALFNRAPDAAGFEFWTQALANGTPLSIVTGAFFSSPETTTIYPAAQTAQQFVSSFYQTVFGRAPDTEGLIFWTDVLNAAGGPTSQAARALLVSNIVDIVSKPLTEKPADLTDAQYAETVRDRDLFSKKNVAALDFAVNVKSNDLNAAKQALVDAVAPTTPTTPTTPEVPPVQTVFTLTLGTDDLPGSKLADTFNANLVQGKATLTADDIIDGGDGIDTLNATLISSSPLNPTLKNIEIVNVTAAYYNVQLDVGTLTGLQRAGFSNSEMYYDGTISNVGEAALFVSHQDADATFTGSTAETLSLNFDTAGSELRTVLVRLGGFQNDGAQATVYDIVAKDSRVLVSHGTGSATVVDVKVAATGTNVLTLAADEAGTVQTLSVTGSGSVDFAETAFEALRTVTAQDGGITLTSTNSAAGQLTVTTGAGDDIIVANGASIKSLNVGAGNDVVTLNAGALAASATVNLGDGDDTLTLTSRPADAAVIDGGDGTDTLNLVLSSCSVATPKLSNIEVVSVANSGGAFLDLADATGVNLVQFEANTWINTVRHLGTAALGVSNQTANVRVSGSTATDLSLTLTKVGTAQSLTQIELAEGGGTAAQATKHSIVASDAYVTFSESQTSATVGNVTVAATGTNALTLSGADAATVTSLAVTGTGSVDFSGQALSALSTFVAQGGGVTLTSLNAAAAALTVTTGGGVDTIVANGANIKSLHVGAGNDVVTLSTGALSATAMVDLGAGNDTLTLAALPTAGATVNGGDGVDTLVVTNSSFTSNDYKALSAVTNFEVLGFSAASPTVDASQLTSFKAFLLNGSFGTSSISNLGADSSVTVAASLTIVNLSAADVDTPVTVNLGTSGASGVTMFGLDVAGIKSVTLTSNGTSANSVMGFTNHDDALITIKGGTDLSISALTATTLGSKVDASLFTGKLTVTGSSLDDVIIGGSGDDKITGGAGADTLTGGAGKDTFFINAGVTETTADTITDFTTAEDKIAFSTATVLDVNFFVGSANTSSFDAALAAANVLLTDDEGMAQISVQRVDDDLFVFFNNGQASGADQVVKLVGVDLNEIAFADIGKYAAPN